jgi:hypothetical protein
VLPFGVKESIVGAGLVGELHCANAAGEEEEEKKKKKDGVRATRGKELTADCAVSGVVCVLGAGNFSAPIEVLTKVRSTE